MVTETGTTNESKYEMPGKNLPQNSTKTIDNNPGGLVVFSFYSSFCIPSHKLDEIRVLRRFSFFIFSIAWTYQARQIPRTNQVTRKMS